MYTGDPNCEVHYHLMGDGHCTCEEYRKKKEEERLKVVRETFWKKWNEEPQAQKIFWIEDNVPYLLRPILGESEVQHILDCIDSMVASICGVHPAGDFVESLLSNKLTEVLETADAVNEVSLKIYHLFLYNKVPLELRRM